MLMRKNWSPTDFCMPIWGLRNATVSQCRIAFDLLYILGTELFAHCFKNRISDAMREISVMRITVK